jgi:hypothetical protein
MRLLLGMEGRVGVALTLGLLSALGEASAQDAAAPAVVVITAGDDATSGAAIRIDGEPSGHVPLRQTLRAGRHLIQVGKRGFVTFSKWVDLESGQVMNMPVTLAPQATETPREPDTGSLLITADVPGIPVLIDGKRRGSTPLVVDGLTEGQHVVEIQSPGEGYRSFSKVVTVEAGKRASVDANIRIAPDLGSLRVITNVPGAIVSLDGEDIGVAPAAKAGLEPGEHTVMARATGYEPVEQSVTVAAGRERVVSLRFTATSTDLARIVVRANVPDATVTIDGEDYGNPPILIEPAERGTHSVVVRAPGYREVRRACSVEPGRNCDVYAELNPLGVPVRVEANVSGAQLFIDGQPRGPVPWEGDLPDGVHQLELHADGYQNYVEQIRLQKSSRVRLIQAIMTPEVTEVGDETNKESQRTDPLRNTVTHAGATVPVGAATLDFSSGWPWLASLGLRTGLTEFLDIGVYVASFGRLTDFTVSTKVGWKASRNFSLGADLQVGGGVGPSTTDPMGKHPTNNFLISLDGIISLHFPPRGAFSIWMAFDFNSDRWDFAGRDSSDFMTYSRQNLVRGRLGGSIEIVVTRKWNVWLEVEGIVAGDERRVLGDVFGGGRPDSLIYGQFGATFKFGNPKGHQ